MQEAQENGTLLTPTGPLLKQFLTGDDSKYETEAGLVDLTVKEASKETLFSFIITYATAALANLIDRFPNEKVVSAFEIFNPQKMRKLKSLCEYGDTEIGQQP